MKLLLREAQFWQRWHGTKSVYYIRRFRHIWGSFEVCLGSFSSSCAALLGMFRGLKFLHRMSSRSVQSLISSKFQPFCGAQPNPQRSFQYIPFLVVECVIHCSPQVSDCIAIDSNLGPGSGPGLREMYHGWPGKLPNAKERSVFFWPVCNILRTSSNIFEQSWQAQNITESCKMQTLCGRCYFCWMSMISCLLPLIQGCIWESHKFTCLPS